MENKQRDQQQSNRVAEDMQQSGELHNEPAKEDNTSVAGLQNVINNGRSATGRMADATKSGMSGGSLDGQSGI